MSQLKMKELESRTGISREAIRFYIREGILPEPEKPKRNVALYSEEHVTRIKMIKVLQDKHFLPLKMVKVVLDSPDAQALATNDQLPDVSYFLPTLLRDTTPGPDRTLQELTQTCGLSERQIRDLHAVDAISLSAEDTLDFRDAAIVECWGQASKRGFDAEHGYDARFFSVYVEAARQLAEFEVDRFMTTYVATLDGRTAAELGAEGVELSNKILSLLHTKFILNQLNKRTGG